MFFLNLTTIFFFQLMKIYINIVIDNLSISLKHCTYDESVYLVYYQGEDAALEDDI